MSSNAGLLIVFSGPSGAGKDTILKKLLQVNQNIKLSISATTRLPRTGEKDGVDYHFLTREKFISLIEKDEVLEHAEYCGNFYCTPSAPIQNWMSNGNDVILEIEVQGGAQIKKKCSGCVTIFILPPSISVLEQRLRDRHTEDEATIQKRMHAAREEIQQAKNYDYVVINDTVENAVDAINTIISAEKHRYIRNDSIIERVLNHVETI